MPIKQTVKFFSDIHAGLVEEVKTSVHHQPELLNDTIIDEKGWTLYPIHQACQFGQIDIVKFLLERKPDLINITNELCYTPLRYAAANNHLEVVEYLLCLGADSSIAAVLPEYNSPGCRPIHWATIRGYSDVVRCLLTHGADVNIRLTDEELHLVHFASIFGQVDVLKVLLNHSADFLRLKDAEGRTAIFLATQYGHFPVVKWLIENDNKGKLSLKCEDVHLIQYALECGQSEIVQFLLDKDPELLDLKTSNGEGLLQSAASRGNTLLVIDLIHRGADIDFQTTHVDDVDLIKYTALLLAIKNGHLLVVQCLLSFGATCPKFLGDERIPLVHFAVASGHEQIVKLLLNIEPDWLDLEDRYGQTLLFKAALENKIDVVRLLLSLDACMDTAIHHPDHPYYAKTPLMIAMERRHFEVANRIILKMCSDKDVKSILPWIQRGTQAINMIVLEPSLRPLLLGDPHVRMLLEQSKGFNPHDPFAFYLSSRMMRSPSVYLSIDKATGEPSIFKPVKELGEGSYGKVRMFQNANGQSISVKSLQADYSLGETASFFKHSKKLQRELECIQLVYPEFGLAKCFNLSVQKARGTFFCARMTMPYFKGRVAGLLIPTLDSPIQLAEIVLKVAQELKRIHELGIVHGDLHHHNVMIEALEKGSFRVYIIDFGEACKITDASATRWGKEGLGVWYAPELVVDDKQVAPHPNQDIYSFGYFLNTLFAHHRAYPDIQHLFPSIPKFIDKSNNDDPKLRPHLDSFCHELESEVVSTHTTTLSLG